MSTLVTRQDNRFNELARRFVTATCFVCAHCERYPQTPGPLLAPAAAVGNAVISP